MGTAGRPAWAAGPCPASWRASAARPALAALPSAASARLGTCAACVCAGAAGARPAPSAASARPGVAVWRRCRAACALGAPRRGALCRVTTSPSLSTCEAGGIRRGLAAARQGCADVCQAWVSTAWSRWHASHMHGPAAMQRPSQWVPHTTLTPDMALAARTHGEAPARRMCAGRHLPSQHTSAGCSVGRAWTYAYSKQSCPLLPHHT